MLPDVLSKHLKLLADAGYLNVTSSVSVIRAVGLAFFCATLSGGAFRVFQPVLFKEVSGLSSVWSALLSAIPRSPVPQPESTSGTARAASTSDGRVRRFR